MDAILQNRLPFAPWTDSRNRRLPGTQAAAPEDWVRIDDAYDRQMRLRDRLIADRRPDVLALLPEARSAAEELLELGLSRAATLARFAVGEKRVRRPDGVCVDRDTADPLGTLGRLFQEDFCLLQKPENGPEHLLTGAVLCFPGGWTLAEKLGRPLGRIHAPVPRYADVAMRVQRMFDGLKPGRPIWRANAHFYDDPSLFSPRREIDRRDADVKGRFVRSEFQVLFRLPASGAIAFSIHTYVVARTTLDRVAEAALVAHPLRSGQ